MFLNSFFGFNVSKFQKKPLNIYKFFKERGMKYCMCEQIDEHFCWSMFQSGSRQPIVHNSMFYRVGSFWRGVDFLLWRTLISPSTCLLQLEKITTWWDTVHVSESLPGDPLQNWWNCLTLINYSMYLTCPLSPLSLVVLPLFETASS